MFLPLIHIKIMSQPATKQKQNEKFKSVSAKLPPESFTFAAFSVFILQKTRWQKAFSKEGDKGVRNSWYGIHVVELSDDYLYAKCVFSI